MPLNACSIRSDRCCGAHCPLAIRLDVRRQIQRTRCDLELESAHHSRIAQYVKDQVRIGDGRSMIRHPDGGGKACTKFQKSGIKSKKSQKTKNLKPLEKVG